MTITGVALQLDRENSLFVRWKRANWRLHPAYIQTRRSPGRVFEVVEEEEDGSSILLKGHVEVRAYRYTLEEPAVGPPLVLKGRSHD